jgi:multiple sugar transport system permease protein
MDGTALRVMEPATAAGRRRGPRGRPSRYVGRERGGIWFAMPFLLAFTLVMIAPLGYAIYTSLYTTRIIGGTRFSGLANYRETLGSGEFWSGMERTAIYAVIQVPVMLAIAFFFAAVFDLGLVRYGKVFRTLFFIPFAVPSVVGAVMWYFMLEPQFGPVARLVDSLGFHGTNFFSPNLVLPSIILIVIWEWTGYNMIILYTALRSVPRELIEAAILDRAPLWRIVLRVKLPMVRPAIVMLVFINMIGALQLFTEPYMIYNFENQAISYSYTPTIYIYNTATAGGQYNLAAAAAVILGIIIVVISAGSLLLRGRRGGSR